MFIRLCGSSIPIECKHRRPVARSIDSTDGRGGIAKRILDKIDIGDDSIFVELTGDGPLREDCTDQLVDIATDAIHSKTNMSTTIGGIEYEILIRDYYTGHRNRDLTKKELEQLFEFVNPNLIYAFISHFNTTQMSPGMYIQPVFKITHSGTVVCRNSIAFDLNVPAISENHYNRVFNGTIERGCSDLSGTSPSVLFVKIPAYEFEDMDRYIVEDHTGSRVSQLERLEQRIGGKLNNFSSINAVALSIAHFDSTTTDDPELSYGFLINENYTPRTQLPDEFWELFDYAPQIGG